ncbi:MAG: NAD(P)/FAD-dependent oxidoreductase [Ruminococcaceae bacterium]|nr:NAD(P)/FAD-dependent oxidoreductase [Oscillospiraceae bacterium]
MEQKRIAVIGGGAAGMMAAIYGAETGAEVTLFEKMSACGRKLRITGKGRCNVTNDCTLQEFLQQVPTNPRFLYSALHFFSTEQTQAFFEERGVPLKVERGKRVFPVSDKAEDIVRCLTETCRQSGVEIRYERVEELLAEDGCIRGLRTPSGEARFDRVIVCTGGMSYPRTGSDGDGYRLVKQVGHTVTELSPSLVPVVSRDRLCVELQGLSLRNVSLRVVDRTNGRTVYEDFGEMMFTHFGLTGPMILSASAHIRDICPGRYEAQINLKPALDEKTLDGRILSDFSAYHNKDFINALGDLLPQKLIPVAVRLSGIDPRKKVHSVTKEERAALVGVIRKLTVSMDGFRPITEAIVTKGGIPTKEVDPKTMESKVCRGLYLAGELLDVDAYTGGFNLQVAFSTGALAGHSAGM